MTQTASPSDPKTCFKCGATKTRKDFYVHRKMADGLLGKCKECTKIDVRTNYADNREYYVEYDKQRAMLPHRVEARKEYATNHPEVLRRIRKNWSENNPEKILEGTRAYREKYPEKYSAHTLVGNAVRSGKLIPQPCRDCGSEESEAHHEYYSKPLEVVWLCKPHHIEADKRRRSNKALEK